MNLPFTYEQFLDVFVKYNNAVWPAQVFLNLLALLAVYLLLAKKKNSSELIIIILAVFWFWVGLIYHISFFTSINGAAYAFGVMFIIQAILFIYAGLIKRKTLFAFSFDAFGITGTIFILYALIIYPALGYYSGHIYPAAPTFGAPFPTIIFTWGVLLFSVKSMPKYLLIIPLLWSLIGISAAINLDIREDFGLAAAGIIGSFIRFIWKRH